MSRLRFPPLGAVLLCPLTALAQQINLSVQNVPPSATRLVAVVDGGGISGTLRASEDIPAGTATGSMALGVSSGGPYRVRVVAFVAGGVFPAILRSGETTGITAGSSTSVNASVTLKDVSFSVDSSVPASADAGTSASIKVNITDPGDFLSGVTFGELWSGTSPPTQSLQGAPANGPLTNTGRGIYQFTTTVNLPTSAGSYYYQFVASAPAFDNPDGTEAPLLIWPNLQAGAKPPQISVLSASGVNLTVTNIPATATRLVAVVDTGSGTGTLRAAQDVSPGAGSSTFLVGLPAGGGYRIRVVAYVAGGSNPSVLRSGQATGVSAASGGTTNVSVSLANISGAVDPSTPSSTAVGQPVTITINVTDPGDFLENGYPITYTYSSPPSQNAPNSSESGYYYTRCITELVSAGSKTYQCSTSISGPPLGTFYYQFGSTNSAFSDSNGQEYPSLFWPDLDTGAQAPQIAVLPANQLFISVGNIPSAATTLIAVVDGGGIGRIWVSQTVASGVSSSSISATLPSGGPYRLRVIAGGFVNPLVVLASGKSDGVSIAPGANNASITLASVSGSVDPSTPTSGAAGASVGIKINLTDPGDFLDSLSSGRLWYSSNSFGGNQPLFSSSYISGTLASTGAGTYQFSAVTNLPTNGGALYFQFGETAPAFAPPSFNGVQNPYLVWPNVETGAPPAQITVIGPLGITSLSPTSAAAGGAAFTLTVNGTGFVSGSTVQWTGASLATTFVSGTQLTASVPSALIAAPGTGSVTVNNPGGAVSNAVTFTIATQTPNISGLSPSSIAVGSPGFTLTVLGSGFQAGAAVQFNGTALSTTFLTSSQLTASVSANLITTQGVVGVTVANPGGSSSNVVTFAIFSTAPSAPTISTLSPNTAPAGGPGFVLTVNGSSFVAGSGVQWNGAALATTYLSSSQLSASVPGSLIVFPGSATISVVNPGSVVSNGAVFTISIAAPTISSLNPSSVAAGGPTLPLNVNGSGFVLGAAVLWNGVALPTAFVNGTQLAATVGPNLTAVPGTATVTVANLGGAASNLAIFTITPTMAPTISTLSPNTAPAGGPGFSLIVNGTSFVFGSGVQWNGAALATTYLSSSQLSASVPGSLIAFPGNAFITVTNPGGVVSNAAIFTISVAAPTLSSLNPSSVTAGGPALPLNVTGSGFVLGAAVLWNGVALPTTFVNGTQLAATVGSNLTAVPGTATVTVANVGGAASNSLAFTISSPPPVISSLSPASALAGGPAFTLAVNGSGFVLGTTVTWNGVSLGASYISPIQVTSPISPNLIASAGTVSVAVVNPDGTKSNSVNFAITTAAPSIVTASPLPSGTAGVQYSQTLTATGGTVPYKSWTVTSGGLPPGITLTTAGNTGLLSGIPTLPGTFTFIAQVTDNANAMATKQFSLTIAGAVSISFSRIVNSASYASGSVAPGEIVTVYGAGMGPAVTANAQLDSGGYISSLNSGTQVLFDGVAAPIIYTQSTEVSVVVPYKVGGKISTQLQVVYQGQTSNTVSVGVSAARPGIFTADLSGSGPASAINEDGSVNSPSNPAPAGSHVSLYATGEGQTNPAGIDGKPATATAPIPVAQPVTATIGGVPAAVQYAGGSPGSVAGLFQVNIQIPQGVTPGGSVPVVVNVGGQSSQANVTVAVR